MTKILPLLLAILAAAGLCSCIEDGITTSPSAAPAFSTDTLDLGPVFADSPSPTAMFKVFNPHDKVLSISRIALEQGAQSRFRINVDGEAGREFASIEIRPKDSIYVLVETTPPAAAPAAAPFAVTDRILFTTNGVTLPVVVTAEGVPAENVTDLTVTGAVSWTGHARRIFGTLTVAPGASLCVGPGVTLYFHDGASLASEGSLALQGTPQEPVTLRGDRMDRVVGSAEFDLLASQWKGITLGGASVTTISHADLRGTAEGLTVSAADGSTPSLTIINSRLHRSGADLIAATGARLRLCGVELSDSKGALLSLSGGEASLTHCTLANSYISSYSVGPLLLVQGEDTRATVDNSLFVNFRAPLLVVEPGDLKEYPQVKLRRCLFSGVAGSDDDNFISCIWGEDVLTNLDAENYIYDYTLQPSSPGLKAADPALLTPDAAIDMLGDGRDPSSPTIGAYEKPRQPSTPE